MDWKDTLSKLNESRALPAAPEDSIREPLLIEKIVQKEPLNIVIDRKGRKGKTATIIEGFTCDSEEVESVEKMLKQKIGTGGSSRGGEILLQGDWKEKVTQILRKEGYKVR